MDEVRALLNELMGPNRDGENDEKLPVRHKAKLSNPRGEKKKKK